MKKKKINLIEAAMKYKQVILAFVVAFMLLGIFALLNMPRREYPEFTVRQGVVIGIYPGATSLEIEEQVTKVVENYIFGFKEVDKHKTHSYSKEGQMVIVVELDKKIHDSDQFWSKFRHGLAELKTQLPKGVVALIGSNDFGDTSALLVTMSSDKKSYRELEDVMEKLGDDLRKISTVSKIKHFGKQQEEIDVCIEKEKLKEFNIDPSVIFTTFKMQESLIYSGEVDNGQIIMPVHIPRHFSSEDDVMNQVIFSDPRGNVVRLKDVAHIERKYEDPDSFIRNNGNNALLISLEMQKGHNIVQFGDEVKEMLKKFKEKTDDDVKINIISDLPEVVDHAISHFMVEFLIAIIAVIIVTMILLPFRVAAVAGVTIPISILITLGIMQLVGIELHIVSLAGLIVVLGMVVDNAIVVIDNHIEMLDQHETPWNAAWKAATELVFPILSATAAIIVAFMPMMIYLTGMAGDFISTFPVTIAIALIISMIVALLMVPFMCFIFIKKGLHKVPDPDEKPKKSFLDIVQEKYNIVVEWTFRNAKKTLLVGGLSVAAGFLIFSTVDQKLFPNMDRAQFPVEIYLSEGTSLAKTEQIVDSLESILSKDPRVTNVASFIGTSSPRFNDLYAPHLPSKNYAQLMVNTISEEATIKILDEYSEKYYNLFPEANIRWKQLAMEDFEVPIEVRVSGDTISDLKTVAANVKAILRKNQNVTWVRDDWGEMRHGVNLKLDANKANQLGYSKTLVAASLMTSLDGLPLTTVWEGDYPVNVVMLNKEDQRDNVDDIADNYVSSPLTRQPIPLRTLAKVEPEWTEGVIGRRNGVRTIAIKADLKRGIIPSNVLNEVTPEIAKIDLPLDVSISYGGDDENTKENMIPLYFALGTSVLIIFFILMIQFKTVRRALLIMSTMLMSILGAAIGLKVTGYPFSMTAFIGVVGLVGIVVRNGIILVDYAMHLVNKEGHSYKEAAISAGKRRMRPIFLTSMAAAMGVVPMIVSGSPLWGPLGSVICFGMIVGMILTLIILPVLYWKVSGNGPSKEELESI